VHFVLRDIPIEKLSGNFEVIIYQRWSELRYRIEHYRDLPFQRCRSKNALERYNAIFLLLSDLVRRIRTHPIHSLQKVLSTFFFSRCTVIN